MFNDLSLDSDNDEEFTFTRHVLTRDLTESRASNNGEECTFTRHVSAPDLTGECANDKDESTHVTTHELCDTVPTTVTPTESNNNNTSNNDDEDRISLDYDSINEGNPDNSYYSDSCSSDYSDYSDDSRTSTRTRSRSPVRTDSNRSGSSRVSTHDRPRSRSQDRRGRSRNMPRDRNTRNHYSRPRNTSRDRNDGVRYTRRPSTSRDRRYNRPDDNRSYNRHYNDARVNTHTDRSRNESRGMHCPSNYRNREYTSRDHINNTRSNNSNVNSRGMSRTSSNSSNNSNIRVPRYSSRRSPVRERRPPPPPQQPQHAFVQERLAPPPPPPPPPIPSSQSQCDAGTNILSRLSGRIRPTPKQRAEMHRNACKQILDTHPYMVSSDNIKPVSSDSVDSGQVSPFQYVSWLVHCIITNNSHNNNSDLYQSLYDVIRKYNVHMYASIPECYTITFSSGQFYIFIDNMFKFCYSKNNNSVLILCINVLYKWLCLNLVAGCDANYQFFRHNNRKCDVYPATASYVFKTITFMQSMYRHVGVSLVEYIATSKLEDFKCTAMLNCGILSFINIDKTVMDLIIVLQSIDKEYVRSAYVNGSCISEDQYRRHTEYLLSAYRAANLRVGNRMGDQSYYNRLRSKPANAADFFKRLNYDNHNPTSYIADDDPFYEIIKSQ